MALDRQDLSWRIQNALFRGLTGLLGLLPYRRRVPLMGWLTARVIAPLAGFDKRIRANLAHACPDLPEDEIRRLIRAVPDNVGRTLAEMYSGKEFVERMATTPFEGPGVAALMKAEAERRPAVIVTGHFGNYLAPRAVMAARGTDVGGLYNPMKNPYFNAHYVAAMQGSGQTMFPRGRQGYASLLRHLKAGGMAGILIDQHMDHGAPLTFFGQPALTALSAAELALKYDAPLIPIYGIRQPDGLSFRLRVEAPIPPGTPEEMTQAANDSLEALTRTHMDQWFWIHRRWKPERARR